MNKDEIMEVSSEKSFSEKCIYCGEEVRHGFYAEDNLGRKLIFPKYITKHFMDNEEEVPIHYRCMRDFIIDRLNEVGGELNGAGNSTRVIIRY